MHQAHRIWKALAVILLLAGTSAASAQPLMVDSIFADLTKPGSPGCALGVYRNDKIIYSRGYGLANIEENVPITPQSVFDVASLSLIVKRVTGQSLRQFAAENIFRPLAMTHTTYRDDHTMLIPNRALAYDRSEMAITN